MLAGCQVGMLDVLDVRGQVMRACHCVTSLDSGVTLADTHTSQTRVDLPGCLFGHPDIAVCPVPPGMSRYMSCPQTNHRHSTCCGTCWMLGELLGRIWAQQPAPRHHMSLDIRRFRHSPDKSPFLRVHADFKILIVHFTAVHARCYQQHACDHYQRHVI